TNSYTGHITNNGLFTFGGISATLFSGNIENNPGATFSISGAQFSQSSGNMTNGGVVNIISSAQFRSDVKNSGTFNVNGTLITGKNFSEGSFNNTGTITINPGGNLTNSGDFTNNPGGAININPGAILENVRTGGGLGNGKFFNEGTINNAGVFDNNGVMSINHTAAVFDNDGIMTNNAEF